MFYNIMRSFKKPSWFQRGMSTPLDALSYTNNALLVMAALGVLGGIFVIAYTGDIASMSHSIASINEMERKYLNEKIDVISVDLTATHTVMVLTNFGRYSVEILGILDGVGTELTCVSNNAIPQDFVISPEDLLEFTCSLDLPYNDTAIHYVVTETRQVITIEP